MFCPSKVVNAIIDSAIKQDKKLTPLQIVKLAYIGHGWWLQQTGEPLIEDEVQAWKYGPVFPTIYKMLKPYGRDVVTRKINPLSGERGQNLSDDAKHFLSALVRLYGDFSGIALSNLTHMPDTPWAKVYQPGILGIKIPNEMIEDHYNRLSHERSSK